MKKDFLPFSGILSVDDKIVLKKYLRACVCHTVIMLNTAHKRVELFTLRVEKYD